MSARSQARKEAGGNDNKSAYHPGNELQIAQKSKADTYAARTCRLRQAKGRGQWGQKDGTRLKFKLKLEPETCAFAVLNRYYDGEGGIVVATIVGDDRCQLTVFFGVGLIVACLVVGKTVNWYRFRKVRRVERLVGRMEQICIERGVNEAVAGINKMIDDPILAERGC
jgi:hypothetical protein